jgi:nucleoside-diphosphate kinase
MALEQTLVLIKPDGLVKSLTGDIISKLSETELKIVAAKIVQVERKLAEVHYRHLKDEPYFEELLNYIMGEYHTKRVMAMVYQGENAIKKVRRLAGATNPEEADPISIRGKYGRITTSGVYENAIHASESKAEAEREIKLWFKPKELVNRIYPVKKTKKTVEEMDWA